MGGIKVDADTQMSRVSGLFACGECSGGMHGANRLGGNSLSDLLVFGKFLGMVPIVISRNFLIILLLIMNRLFQSFVVQLTFLNPGNQVGTPIFFAKNYRKACKTM
ncbi:MAG: hypothetical protein Ct9H300mP2_2080 [Candidatus Neomarinimicrobiota bacterium]|nr:MAG: hypothetical protein Ct9H300mP2_2080 [Candidatus Neomarinimicrobiota bacterium]